MPRNRRRGRFSQPAAPLDVCLQFVHQHFYYLAAFHAFAFYGLWGQILARALLAAIDTDTAAIEAVAGFLPVLGVPFLFVSWIMLLSMAGSMFGKPFKTALAFVARGVFSAAAGAWLAVTGSGSRSTTESRAHRSRGDDR